jgi:hypothetical protein
MKRKASAVLSGTEGTGTVSTPVGWLGFGLGVVLLSLHNVGLYSMNAMVFAAGVFIAGLALFIAGIMEWKRDNTFAATVFVIYGTFWIALVAMLIMPGWGMGKEIEHGAMGFYLLVWGLLTAGLFFGSLKTDVSQQFFFITLALMFVLLSLNDFTGWAVFQHCAGFTGLVCGLSGIYAGLAGLLNGMYGRTVLPVCPVK